MWSADEVRCGAEVASVVFVSRRVNTRRGVARGVSLAAQDGTSNWRRVITDCFGHIFPCLFRFCKMDAFSASGPPPFLPTPGDPVIPWVSWVPLFRNFLLAIGGEGFSQTRQRALLLHCLGTEGQRIYNSLPATVKQEQETLLDQAIRALDGFFKPKTNVVAERYKFRSRGQQVNETTSQWVSSLRQLATTCEYEDRVDEFVRDQIVEKTNSARLRQRLLLEPDLTLSKTLTIAESVETAEREALVMQQGMARPPSSSSAASVVSAVQSAVPRPRRSTPSFQSSSARGRAAPPQGRAAPSPAAGQGGTVPDPTCFCCGGPHLARSRECPARRLRCHKCGKMGHFASVCRGKRSVSGVNAVAGTIMTVDQGRLQVPVVLGKGKLRSMVVDTGSPVSIVPWHWVRDREMKPTEDKFQAYGGARIQVMGTCDVTVTCKGETSMAKVYVVPHGCGIMGLDLMQKFKVNVVANEVCNLTCPSKQDEASAGEAAGPAAGLISGYSHRVTVNPAVPPVRQPLRRLPLAIREEVSARLAELERDGVIERVHASQWVSPIVVGRKRNGQVRLCVDLRQVNRAVVTDGYPIPHMEEILHRLQGSHVYSMIDLKDAYHQVNLHPDSRDLTTFITHEGLFRYMRCPFGLASSGPAFQKIMCDMLKGVKGVEVYLDDIVVHATTREEHDRRVSEVLAVLRSHQVKVNEGKSRYGVTSISFLGLQVSHNSVQLDPERIAPLLKAETPDSPAKLQSFLGSVSYYARFIPGFSTLVEPLRALLRQSTDQFQMTQEAIDLVGQVKKRIAQSPSLALFDPALPTIVTTDASDVGLGAYLSQRNGYEERVIAYASRVLSPAERSYSAVEKEALSAVWAVERWHTFLWGRRFLLRTDNQALVTIFGPKGSSRAGRRIARWESRLLSYSFDVAYLKSADNSVADGLSRLPVSDEAWHDNDDVEIALIIGQAALSKDEWQSAAAEDEQFQAVTSAVQTGRWPRARDVPPQLKAFYQVKGELSCADALMFRGHRLVVPFTLRKRLIDLAHEGHQGQVRTKQRLREKYWWPAMDREVEQCLAECSLCAAHSKSSVTCSPPLQPIPLPDGAWRDLQLDIIGPLSGGHPQYRFGIVLVDRYSRWPEVAFTPSATAASVIDFLESVFAREGFPERLHTDNGSQFCSDQFQQFLRAGGIRHLRSSPYSPQTCGMVERLNRTVKDAVTTARALGQSVPTYVRTFLMNYRATPHPGTGQSPFQLLRGRGMRTPLDVMAPERAEDAPLRKHAEEYQRAYKERYDRRSRGLPRWRPGDWVKVKVPNGKGRKFGPPVQVARQTGPVSYRLVNGERVHARRLVSAGGSAVFPSASCDPFVSGTEGVTPVQCDLPVTAADLSTPQSALAAPRPVSEVPRDPPVTVTDLPPPQSVSVAQGRPKRTVRPPDRYSP